jgi:hypothetical protein
MWLDKILIVQYDPEMNREISSGLMFRIFRDRKKFKGQNHALACQLVLIPKELSTMNLFLQNKQ